MGNKKKDKKKSSTKDEPTNTHLPEWLKPLHNTIDGNEWPGDMMRDFDEPPGG
jgi:hypothetical protein